MRITIGLVTIYFVYQQAAIGQTFDPTTDINNQIDRVVSQNLQAPTGAAVTPESSTTTTGAETSAQAAPVTNGVISAYSGLTTDHPSTALTFKQGAWIFQETFNEKNSFTGTGVTDSYATQIGTDFQSSWGTDIQPNFSCQYGSRDLIGTTTYRADTYSGSVNMVQKVFPFEAGQPHKVYNLVGEQEYKGDSLHPPEFVKDVFPNFDMYMGFATSFSGASLSNRVKGSWMPSSQDSYGLAPSLNFNLYLKRLDESGNCNPMPNTISITPTWLDQMGSLNNGTSSSAGVLSIADRNTWYFVLNQAARGNDLGEFSTESIQLIQTNTLLHDTNQEPATAPTKDLPYQTWGKFGLAVEYQKGDSNVKLEYTYEAFNNMYQAHNVVATFTLKF